MWYGNIEILNQKTRTWVVVFGSEEIGCPITCFMQGWRNCSGHRGHGCPTFLDITDHVNLVNNFVQDHSSGTPYLSHSSFLASLVEPGLLVGGEKARLNVVFDLNWESGCLDEYAWRMTQSAIWHSTYMYVQRAQLPYRQASFLPSRLHSSRSLIRSNRDSHIQ